MKNDYKLPLVDLFCGAGGLSVGFEQAGFKSVFANDIDEYACETYEFNHPDSHVFMGDVSTLRGDNILEQSGLESIPLVIGGPNCQGVSLRGNRDPNDPKNAAFLNFSRLISELQPDWFVMENVPGLMHRHNRDLVTSIFEEFDSIGYRCGGEILLAADYGVPQLRYRFILIGNKHGLPIIFPNQTHFGSIQTRNDLFADERVGPEWLTVQDAIGDLPKIENGGGKKFFPYDELRGKKAVKKMGLDEGFQSYCKEGSKGIHNHICHKTPDQNIRLIRHIPPGGNWKNIPEDIRPARFRNVALKDHTTTYGRLRWKQPARTITTYFNNISSGAFTHPEQHRGISVREGARLQGFPDSFVFKGTLARQYRQVGNAVPPRMAYNIAASLIDTFDSSWSNNHETHGAAVVFNRSMKQLEIKRPLQGMRFNLDKHLVKGVRGGNTNSRRSAAVG